LSGFTFSIVFRVNGLAKMDRPVRMASHPVAKANVPRRARLNVEVDIFGIENRRKEESGEPRVHLQ
jgi:hypothetical protein